MSIYEVGAVLWIIHTDRPGLMAYRVVEEITKKTLEGEQIQYLVQAAKPKTKTVRLETIQGSIFEDSEEAKQKMDPLARLLLKVLMVFVMIILQIKKKTILEVSTRNLFL